MEEYYFEVPVSNSKVLCVGPITRRETELVLDEASFCDGFGYYLFVADAEKPNADIEIIAKLVSRDAASRLGNLLKLGNAHLA